MIHEIDGETVTIKWERGAYMESCDHSKYYVMVGFCDNGYEYEGTGEYICDELAQVTDIEKV